MTEITKNKELQKDLAKQVHDMMLDRLRDVDGLDAVDWWPLAPGIWVIIILLLLTLFTQLGFYLKKRAWRRSWKGKTFEELDQMQKNITQTNAQNIAIKLSEILRRVAMYKYSRNNCAALVGQAWLQWLTQHDNNKFDWVKNGSILTEEVFAPHNIPISIKRVVNLIKATKNWVK